MSIADGTEYPIHDIDIFTFDGKSTSNIEESQSHPIKIGLAIINYKNYIYLEDGVIFYEIADATRSGFLNEVSIRFSRPHLARMAKSRHLLNGFDINACGTGIDIESGKLLNTKDFEEFLDTRQLKVSYPSTPSDTAIRLCEKYHDLHCYCNFDLEMLYLAHLPLLPAEVYYKSYFSNKSYESYLVHKDIIDKYFKVYEYTPLESDTKEFPEEIKFYTLMPKKNMNIIDELMDCHSLNMLKAKWDLLFSYKKRKPVKRVLLHSGLSRDIALINRNFADGNWDDKHLDRIERFIGKHPALAYLFNNIMRLNAEQQLKAIRLIEAIVDGEGIFIIGLIENAEPIPSSITAEWINSLIEDYKLTYSGSLKEREDLCDFEYAPYVRELVSVDDLTSEGLGMHHCVGGYARAIRDRGSLIFHIEADGEGSTLELEKIEPGRDCSCYFRFSQHRSKWNKEPVESHKKIAQALRAYLFKKYNGKNYEDYLKERDVETTTPPKPSGEEDILLSAEEILAELNA